MMAESASGGLPQKTPVQQNGQVNTDGRNKWKLRICIAFAYLAIVALLINGERVPRRSVDQQKPVANFQCWVPAAPGFWSILQAARSDSTGSPRKLYRINDYYDVRQMIAPSGTTCFATPFNQFDHFRLIDAREQVFLVGYYSLMAYYKADGYWQLFTFSDGYRLLGHTVPYAATYDYRDWLAIVPDTTVYPGQPEATVTLFDKHSRQLSAVPLARFKQMRADWATDDYTDTVERWIWEENSENGLVRENLRTGAREYYSPYMLGWDQPQLLTADGDKMVAVNPRGLRIFNPDGTEQFRQLRAEPTVDRPEAVRYHDGQLLELKNQRLQLWTTRTGVLALDRTCTTSFSLFDFDRHYLCRAEGAIAVIENIRNGVEVMRLALNSPITGIEARQPGFLVTTLAGFSTIAVQPRRIRHYLDNRELAAGGMDYSDECGCGEGPALGFRWLGRSGAYRLGMMRRSTTKHPEGVVKWWAYAERQDRLLEMPVALLPLSLRVLIEKAKYVTIADTLCVFQTTVERTYKIVGFTDEVTQVLSEFTLPGGDMSDRPNAFAREEETPQGHSICEGRFWGGRFWMVTQRLYSFSLADRKWRGHYVPTAGVMDEEYFVTPEGIYGSGNTGGYTTEQWMRIDRNTFRPQHYCLCSDWRAVKHSPRLSSDRIIYATDRGIGWHSFNDGSSGVIPLPEPVYRVDAMAAGGYLAVNQTKLFRIDANNMVTAISLPRPLNGTITGLCYDDEVAWIGSERQFTRYDFKTGIQDTFVNESTYSCRIIPYPDEVWIFAGTVFRYDKRSAALETFPSAYGVDDVMAIGDNLYLMTRDGLYEVNRHTREMRYSSLGCGGVTRCGEMFFFRLGGMILQMDAARFYQSFVGSPGHKFR